MRRLIALVLVFVCATVARGQNRVALQIALSESAYANPVVWTNIGSVICQIKLIPATTNNIDIWMNSFSSNFVSVANTNKTIYIQRVLIYSLMQELLSTLTGPERTRYRNLFKDRPGIRADFSRDPDQLLKDWGVKKKQVVLP